MSSESSDKIASASKIRLVVTDDAKPSEQSPEPDAQPAIAPQTATTSTRQTATTPSNTPGTSSAPQTAATSSEASDLQNAKHVLTDLPADEFFKVLEESTPEQLQSLLHAFEKGTRSEHGSKLWQRVIGTPQEPRGLFSIIFWWECRRPLFNLLVGVAGVPSVLLLAASGLGGTALVGVIVYAIFANLCFTLGAPAEIVARACYKDKAQHCGPMLLTLGLIFSFFLTLFLEVIATALIFLAMPHIMG